MPTHPHSNHHPNTWSVDRVRSTFIEFFAGKGATPGHKGTGGGGRDHVFYPSSPAIPHEDPTLLFANAGMNQFKPLFLGKAEPGSPLYGLKRAVNSQKCIRAGGKHNDLDDVGKDTYHHTFFEMLGNWSFGDYFKAEAISWAWELLTKVYELPEDALYATYFGGNKDAGLEPDLETQELWLKYLPPERVIPGNMKDNFWEMGDTGPCGPCTEIHVDRLVVMGLSPRLAPELVNQSDPDMIEIWNNVFIQFNREADRSLKPLPAKHVDTGMGLERITSILQRQRSNYDTDVFMPIFAAIEQRTAAPHGYSGKLGKADVGNVDTAYRVIADHIRTLTFAITDGAVPSNEGRGYVLRRILRRAVRYGRQVLGAKTGFFAGLVPVVVENFGDFFPELRKNPQRVAAIILEEEESFGKTLDRGLKLFDEAIAGGGVAADDAFKLHDTYGFPIDLTMQMAEERALRVDVAGYERLMEEAKEKARAGGKFGSGGGGEGGLTLPPDALARLPHLHVKPTEDVDKYHGRDIRASVKAIWNGHNFDEHARADLSGRKPVGVILDKTNFYAEMGGQVADHGTLFVTRENRSSASDKHEGGEFRVESVMAFGGYVLHIGHLVRGELRVGDDVQCKLDHSRRNATAGNHTATHLLNLALRNVLSDSESRTAPEQKGSLVAPDRLRFDFSHNKAVTPDELAAIEHGVRAQLKADHQVYAEAAPLMLARAVQGVRAVFGETYPDPVRVISIGVPVQDLLDNARNANWEAYSVEFCGGTHVQRTSEIGEFALIGEEAVAKGIRRIVAVTGTVAVAAVEAGEALLERAKSAKALHGESLVKEVQAINAELEQATLPSVRKTEVRGVVAELQERLKAEQKAAEGQRAQAATQLAKAIADEATMNLREIVVSAIELGGDRKALQAAMSAVVSACPKAAVMLVSPDAGEDRLAIMAQVPEATVKRGLNAGKWVQAACAVCDGKGGGKPDSAQGGGVGAAKLRDVLKEATSFAHKSLGM